jgi:hypothetical protein
MARVYGNTEQRRIFVKIILKDRYLLTFSKNPLLFCIFATRSCRGLDAQMPTMPNPAPMSTWRGQPLTHEAAESLFVGWKQQGPQLPEGDHATKPWSWLVAAGKNPAVSSTHYLLVYSL